MKRCRDCVWWRVRKGCVQPKALARTHATDLHPSDYQVYKHIECDEFTEKKETA